MKRVGFVLLLIFLGIVSCGEEASRQTVPFAPVNFRVDPNGYDHILKNPNTYKIFMENKEHPSSERFGYGGVLVVSGPSGDLHAFDLCCPHEGSRQVLVNPEYDGSGYNGKVKCASCGSVFVTMFGLGSVESGPSTEPLQRYSVVPQTDGSYRVIN